MVFYKSKKILQWLKKLFFQTVISAVLRSCVYL